MTARRAFLAITTDGTAAAWGYNQFGQLGDGTTTNRTTPVQVSGLSGVSAVGGGAYHSVALKSEGTVWAWGNNSYGQLGDGTTTTRLTPVQVSGLTGVTAISVGYGHNLARKADGTVWAWGLNNYGQPGDGTTTNRSTPVQVSGLSGVSKVAAGSYHSLAVKTDLTLRAWGRNQYGQLGDGTTTERHTPVPCNLTAVTSVSAGAYHSLATRMDGSAWAWGYNFYGQLGDGTTTNRSNPVPIGGMGGTTALAAGGYHSLARKSDGTVWAWGRNDHGQLGDGTTTNRSGPVQASGLSGITAVAGGGSHSLARKNDQVAWAVGYNVYGQLGDGTTTERSLAAPVTGLISIKYYYFNGQRVAMRRNGVLYYLAGDHLGSTSVVIDATGNKVAENRYKPYGEQRWSDGTLPTDYRFTGQRLDDVGLYQMGARWYDPSLGRWISPDTIIPDLANPQSLNRYSYVYNNTLRYIDPTGHLTEQELRTILGDDYEVLWYLWTTYDPYWAAILGELKVGDTLFASMLGGLELRFEGTAGTGIRISGYGPNGAFSTRLQDWQAQGAYGIKKAGTTSIDPRVTDKLFNEHEFGIGNEITVPVFDYNNHMYGWVSPVYLGARKIRQEPGKFVWYNTTSWMLQKLGVPSGPSDAIGWAGSVGTAVTAGAKLSAVGGTAVAVGLLAADLTVSVIEMYKAPCGYYTAEWPGLASDVNPYTTFDQLRH